MGGHMRRLVTYLNALLLGVILGMVFLALVQESSSPGPREVRTSSVVLDYELVGVKNQQVVLVIPGTTMPYRDRSPESCRCHVKPLFHGSFSTIAISVSVVRPDQGHHPCVVGK